jgi:ribosomal protein S12 methylthiotransferase accessory factor YcaO
VLGAAVEPTESPARRAYLELLERAATMEALSSKRDAWELRTRAGEAIEMRAASEIFPESGEPQRWRYARSNGVALHRDWSAACLRAFWELAERDRLLRSWYGEIAPVRVTRALEGSPLAATTSYEWTAHAFPEERDTFSRGVEVAMVVGFPIVQGAPLVLGSGARPDREGAVAAATREALQGLAFLWGEALPKSESPPSIGPSPMHHLERFQWPAHHAMIRAWLEGAHVRLAASRERAEEPRPKEVAFVDLTPQWLAGGMRVVKACCAAAVPLTFGDAPNAAHLPFELRAHPIA